MAKAEKDVLEKKVKEKINKEVELAFPGMWPFMPVQTGMGKSGVPDHLFCLPVTITPEMVGKTYGMFAGVEAKRLGKKPTPKQYEQLALIIGADGFGHFCAGRPAVLTLIEQMRSFFCLKS